MICVVALTSASTANAGFIVNGSFETGNFAGWGLADLTNPHQPLTVRGNGFNTGFGFFSTTATNGSFSATHGFDGNGPGTIRLFQDIGTIDSASNLLTFDYRVAWDMLNYGGSTAPRTFSLNVFQAGTFNSLASTELLRANAGTANFDTGNLVGSINLSAFQGQNVRIAFDSVIPQNFTGPAFLQLDNVQLNAAAVPEPSSLVLMGSLFVAGAMANRRRRRPSAAIMG
jgi:hypothetical protein